MMEKISIENSQGLGIKLEFNTLVGSYYSEKNTYRDSLKFLSEIRENPIQEYLKSSNGDG